MRAARAAAVVFLVVGLRPLQVGYLLFESKRVGVQLESGVFGL
jgi:hypothetical protein